MVGYGGVRCSSQLGLCVLQKGTAPTCTNNCLTDDAGAPLNAGGEYWTCGTDSDAFAAGEFFVNNTNVVQESDAFLERNAMYSCLLENFTVVASSGSVDLQLFFLRHFVYPFSVVFP